MKRTFLLLILLSWCLHSDASVVCIHGFLVNNTTMMPLKRCLEKSGFDVCLYKYEAREETLQCHGLRLKEMLKQMARNNPGEPINFVAHSIGGVVLRVALSLPGCPEEAKIGRAVLLAPPNRGSMLGRKMKDVLPIKIAMGEKSGKQLLEYSPCQMLALGTFPPTCQVLVIAGARGMNKGFDNRPNDGYLAVEETRLDTPHAFMTLDLKHGALLTNRESLRLTRDFLLSGQIPVCK